MALVFQPLDIASDCDIIHNKENGSYAEVVMDEQVVIFLLVGYILGMLTIIFINAPKRS